MLCTPLLFFFDPPSFFLFFFSFLSVPAGGWLGSGGEGDWRDTASTRGCYLCKTSADVLLPLSYRHCLPVSLSFMLKDTKSVFLPPSLSC